MEKSELIDLIKVPAVNVMKEKKVLASIIIAESIRILFADDMITCYSDLVAGNNPMAVEAPKGYDEETIYNEKKKVLYRTYDSLEEGISNYITVNEEEKFNRIKEVYDYKEALSKLASKFYDTAPLKTYIEAYRLYDIDNAQIKKMYSGSKNVVEHTGRNTVAMTLRDMVNTHDGVGIGKTRAVAERESRQKMATQVKNNKITGPLKAGTKIALHSTNLYKDLKVNIPTRAITGTFYLVDGRCVYERYAIVLKLEYVGKSEYILGYIDESDIRVSTN